MATLNFNAHDVDPNVAYDPLPSGWYAVKITESTMKPTKDNTGAYLELEMVVLEGTHMGRKLFDRLNLQNKNATAVEIAQRTLSAICHSIGVYQVNDSQQLHGYPMQVKVSVRPADANYAASNDIKGYRNINGETPGATTGAPAQAAPQAAPAYAPQAAPAPVYAPAPAPQAAPTYAAPAPAPAPAPTPTPAPTYAAPAPQAAPVAPPADMPAYVPQQAAAPVAPQAAPAAAADTAAVPPWER